MDSMTIRAAAPAESLQRCRAVPSRPTRGLPRTQRRATVGWMIAWPSRRIREFHCWIERLPGGEGMDASARDPIWRA